MKTYEQVAVKFASALVSGGFSRARELLAPTLRGDYPAERLRGEFYEMFSDYASGNPTTIRYSEEFALED